MVMAQDTSMSRVDDEDEGDSQLLELAIGVGRSGVRDAGGQGSEEISVQHGYDHSRQVSTSPFRSGESCGISTSHVTARHWPDMGHSGEVAGPPPCIGSTQQLQAVENVRMGLVSRSPLCIFRGEALSQFVQSARWGEQLLNLCAEAIASDDIGQTQYLMSVLNELASFTGDPNQRLAAHGLKALYCRVTGGKEAAATYVRPLFHQEETLGPRVVHRALSKWHEYCVWHQITYTVSTQTLLEAFAGKSHLHIIDIGVLKGLQWPVLIDALVNRAGGPPASLRITTIVDERREDSVCRNRQVDADSADFMNRLVIFARSLGLPLDLKTLMGGPMECIKQEDLNLREGETLAVCCQFRLHRLLNEPGEVHGAPRSSPGLRSRPARSMREVFLDFLFKLEPTILIVSENDTDHSSPDFLTRCKNVVSFWWRFFESTSFGFRGIPYAEERLITEYEAGMILLNSLACEGKYRIERNQIQPDWTKQILRAGFVPMSISVETKKAIRTLMDDATDGWGVVYTDTNILKLLWRHEPGTFCSVWKAPYCTKRVHNV